MPVCDHCKETVRTILRPMQDNNPIKKYSDLFSIYIVASGLRPDSELAKTRFVAGLSPDNRAELGRFGRNWPSIAHITSYLSAVEDYRNAICPGIDN